MTTLLKFKKIPADKSFNTFMDDFFPAMPSLYREDSVTGIKHFAPVNIRETETGFELELIAPGLDKEDFKISLHENNLTVAVEKYKGEEQKENFIRREYKFQNFKRSFTVADTIDAEKISAKYVNGVLTLNLPKKVEVKEAAKQISIQ